MTIPAPLSRAVRDRLAQRPLALLLDVDGTLSPIAPTPEAAGVPAETRAILERLVAARDVHVALVSGRAARDAHRMVGVDGVWAIGNHGFETRSPDGTLWTDPALAPWREHVAAAAAAIEPIVRSYDGTRLEDKHWTLSVHHRQAGAAMADVLRPELEEVADAHGLRLTSGKMVFELRPPVEVDKGSASLLLLDRLLDGAGAALYAGDDRTDEDAFRALRARGGAAVTIRVGQGTSEAPIATAAEFVLADVDAMRAFLAQLAEAV